MNRLFASALLGLGLVSSVVACSDDEEILPGDAGGTSAGGTASAGKGGDGSATSGSSTGGAGGDDGGSGGSGGSGGKAGGGSSSGGSSVSGGAAGSPEGGIAGESSGGAAGAGGDGAGGEPPVQETQLPTPYWLNKFCDAISTEQLDCDNSISWFQCYGTYIHYASAGDSVDGECVDDDEEFTKLLAVINGLDAVAAECPDPDVMDFSCNLAGEPTTSDVDCQQAMVAFDAAYTACVPQP